MREYRALLKGVPFQLITPLSIGIKTTVPETGKSFEDNACLKAETLARESHLLTLADDSGLEVDALNGEPGLMSARYAGENATDGQRIKFLLDKMKYISESKRNALFRCVIAISREGRKTLTCEGECKGYVAFEPRGKNGFGYDPIFFIPELGKTMAELPAALKNKMSHRAQAAKKARRILYRIAYEQRRK